MSREDISLSTLVATHETPVFSQRRITGQKEHPHLLLSEVATLEPRPPHKRRIRTLRGMRRYLHEEEGLEFIPKSRRVVVPRKEFSEHSFGGFLSHCALIDRFGSNHVARDRWYQEQRQYVDPQLFDTVVRNNQFTLSSITSALSNTYWLSKNYYPEFSELSEELRSQYERMQEAYRGEFPDNNTLVPYITRAQEHHTPLMYAEDLLHRSLSLYYRDRYRLLSYQEKLKLVHFFSDSIISSLWLIAHHTNPTSEATRINITGKRKLVLAIT